LDRTVISNFNNLGKKEKLKRVAAIVFCLLIGKLCLAQSEFVHQFTATQNDEVILLNFTIAGGITCLGTEIQRSPDSINFQSIGNIAGICGSDTKDVSYAFTDTAPLVNQDNFYRLELGQVGFSHTIKIKFTDYESGVFAFPNPAGEETMVNFLNSKNELFKLQIFDTSGRMRRSITTRNNAVKVSREDLLNGMYFFTLSQNEKIQFSGNFIFQ
jgi:hypothetical protein